MRSLPSVSDPSRDASIADRLTIRPKKEAPRGPGEFLTGSGRAEYDHCRILVLPGPSPFGASFPHSLSRRSTHLPAAQGPIRHSAIGVGISPMVPSGRACSFGICPLSPKVHGRNSEIIGLMFMKYRGRSSMERFEHKGIVFFVKPDRKEGFYSFRFILNKRRCGEGRRPSCAA